jgi:GNAT superfamily N-acetyltransferase
MKVSPSHSTRPEAVVRLRAARFEEVAEILRLVRRAVDHGCRDHYTPAQRDAVYLAYAVNLFEETLGPFETVVAEHQGRIVGMAQLDPFDQRLRALFVDGDRQQRGFGRALIREIEERATGHGLRRLQGAMAVNAISFYLRAGFRPCGGPERLMSAGISVPVQRMEKELERRRSIEAAADRTMTPESCTPESCTPES